MLSVSAALDDPEFLERHFRGPSWDAWRAIWKTAQGEADKMTAREREIFAQIAEREPLAEPVKELIVIGGKDSTAAAAIVCAAATDYRKFIRPGERPAILCLGVDRLQARIVLDYTRALFEQVPILAPLKAFDSKEGLELTNGNEVLVVTNSFRVVRGRTVPLAIFDEAAFWRDENYASPDKEVYRAVIPAMSTIPTAMLVVLTTPYRRQGLVYEKFMKSFGQPDPRVLVVKAPTELLNPNIDPQIIADAMEDDAASARAEYFCEWRDDVSNFIERAAVEACVVDYAELPPVSGRTYVAFLDASGGSGKDDMAVGIAHREDGVAVLDVVRCFCPPFSPAAVTHDISELFAAYGIRRAISDKWGGDWVVEAFHSHGIAIEPIAKTKSEIYLDALSAINSGSVRFPRAPKLINQICGLERRSRASGKDLVDHGPHSHDDVANAGLGALMALGGSELTLKFQNYLVDDKPVPLPARADAVFASLVAPPEGRAAVIFWALSRYVGPALTIVDFDVPAFSVEIFSMIGVRVLELARQCRAIPLGLFTDDMLAEQAQSRGLQAMGLSYLLAHPSLGLVARGHVNSGKVKIAKDAHEKSKVHPLGASLDFRFAANDDPLQMAAMLGVLVALEQALRRK